MDAIVAARIIGFQIARRLAWRLEPARVAAAAVYPLAAIASNDYSAGRARAS